MCFFCCYLFTLCGGKLRVAIKLNLMTVTIEKREKLENYMKNKNRNHSYLRRGKKIEATLGVFITQSHFLCVVSQRLLCSNNDHKLMAFYAVQSNFARHTFLCETQRTNQAIATKKWNYFKPTIEPFLLLFASFMGCLIKAKKDKFAY